MHHTEQTVQTIGKTRVVVVSSFQADGLAVRDRVARLLQREAQAKTRSTFDNDSQAVYNEQQ